MVPRISIVFFRTIFLRFTNYISNDVRHVWENYQDILVIQKKNTRLVLGSISSLGSTLDIPTGSSKCYTLSMVLVQLPLKAALGIIVTNKP